MSSDPAAAAPQVSSSRTPWAWVPTLYLAQGLPNAAVVSISVVMFKGMGISNADIALYTSWLYLPWVIKPLWSPVVDILQTRRGWIWAMQFLIGAGFAGVALTIPTAHFFRYALAFMWLLAFSSATHDIAADGFYMLATTERQQAFFGGIRTTFFRLAVISGQGLLVILAGLIQNRAKTSEAASGNVRLSWVVVFLVLTAMFLIFPVYHRLILPRPERDRRGEASTAIAFMNEFLKTFASFFRKPRIVLLLLFLLFYRFAEAQLVKLVQPFLLDPRTKGGLGLTTAEVGFVYGTVGVIALTCGGLLGGVLVSRNGLKFWLWPMVLIMHLPDAVFVYLAYAQPTNFGLINLCVAIEQFGYGFGFTGYMLYMIYVARGQHETAHYAICTGFMALGMMLPGMLSGRLQPKLGYEWFFIWVMLSTIPGFLVTALVPLDRDFGKK